ncbi:MAG: alpha/beta hydrolase [Holosporaceae bacterium]|jgi:pimeloyl-[acyl-carrier protein] methyl ester esterase|nr:alpha/beta hydrolase [Holosporaceae bacterium]
MKYTFLLRHGFGFFNEYWRNLIPLLDGDVVFFDDDYVIDKTKHYIGIGHSIGFQKLNNSGIKFDFLIGLQGFLNFCGNEPNEKQLREKNIDRLMKMLASSPLQTLKTFYDACQYPDPIPEDIIVDDLTSDLASMKKSYLHCDCPTLIIGGDADQIVPMHIIEDNFRRQPKVVVEKINGVAHSLGFAKPKEVSKKIKDFVDEGKNNTLI